MQLEYAGVLLSQDLPQNNGFCDVGGTCRRLICCIIASFEMQLECAGVLLLQDLLQNSGL